MSACSSCRKVRGERDGAMPPRQDDAVGKDGARDGVASALLALFSLFMLSSLTQSLYGSLPLNKAIGFGIAVVLLYWFASSALTHLRVLGALALGGVALMCLACGASIGQDMSDFVYLVTTVLVLLYASDARNRDAMLSCFDRHATLLGGVAFACALLLLGLLVTGTGYETSWGGERYFRGLASNEHALASSCCLLLTAALLYGQVRAHGLLTAFVVLAATLAILATGARTYLIPLVVVLLCFVRDVASWKWLRVVLYVAMTGAFVLLLLGSGMLEKFEFAFNNEFADSLLSAFTNGRNEIWAHDIGLFAQFDPVRMAFGGSFSQVYASNSQALDLYIWSHDDFVMLLCSAGLAGIVVYIASMASFFKGVARSASGLLVAALAVYVLGPALLNGFYPYQHLVYSAVFFALYAVERNYSYERGAHGRR
ncbi:MAG: hypothetical protein Q4B35_04600 [Slackia sp.]|nr:hypothetical protein [Slackia sp.]